MRRILGMVKRADERFGLINDGDSIAIGLSGGKDSMLMVKALSMYRRFSKKEYSLTALCVDLGFRNYNTPVIKEYAKSLDVPFEVVKTDIAEVVFDIRKEKNPCSLCSKMRKGALYGRAVELGCNKAAFAHHADDVMETFILSLMYEARINTFSPRAYLSRTGITLVRPFILASEADIKAAIKRNGVPVAKNPCPADMKTKREEAGEVLRYLNSINRQSKENIFRAISNTQGYNLWDKLDQSL